MLTFFPKFIVEDISGDDNGTLSGTIGVDILERFNLYASFRFVVSNFNSHNQSIIVYKNGKVVLCYRKNAKGRGKRFSQEQQLIYAGLVTVLSAYLGQLNTKHFALTKIERYANLISVSFSALDREGVALIKACL